MATMPNQPMDSYEAAAFLGLKSVGTLANWRGQNRGPAYIRIGSNIRYLRSDLEAWITAQRITTTESA